MNLIFHDLLGIILEVYFDDVVVKSDSMDASVWVKNESTKICVRCVGW
jgi:hypothetical protein